VRFTLLLVSATLMLSASPLMANPIGVTPWGDLDLFADATGGNELISDQVPGLVPIYVVLVSGPPGGATAVQFSAPKPACFPATWLSDTCPFPIILGNSQAGAAVAFGTCWTYPVHVLTMHYFGQGLSICCYYWVRPDPNVPSGKIEASDCNFNVVYVSGGATIINKDRCVTPVEETTWGRVKSLYATE
jgi:hypothetical protein